MENFLLNLLLLLPVWIFSVFTLWLSRLHILPSNLYIMTAAAVGITSFLLFYVTWSFMPWMFFVEAGLFFFLIWVIFRSRDIERNIILAVNEAVSEGRFFLSEADFYNKIHYEELPKLIETMKRKGLISSKVEYVPSGNKSSNSSGSRFEEIDGTKDDDLIESFEKRHGLRR
jgi:hypothetical protein